MTFEPVADISRTVILLELDLLNLHVRKIRGNKSYSLAASDIRSTSQPAQRVRVDDRVAYVLRRGWAGPSMRNLGFIKSRWMLRTFWCLFIRAKSICMYRLRRTDICISITIIRDWVHIMCHYLSVHTSALYCTYWSAPRVWAARRVLHYLTSISILFRLWSNRKVLVDGLSSRYTLARRMARYYCGTRLFAFLSNLKCTQDYCDAFLTHDSATVRKQHNSGFKHKANVRNFYTQFALNSSVKAVPLERVPR